MTNNKPTFKTREGQIQGTIWENEKEGKKGKFTSYSVQIEKSYSTDEGKTWNKTNSYFAQDVDKLEKVVADIKAYLVEKKVPTAKE